MKLKDVRCQGSVRMFVVEVESEKLKNTWEPRGEQREQNGKSGRGECGYRGRNLSDHQLEEPG